MQGQRPVAYDVRFVVQAWMWLVSVSTEDSACLPAKMMSGCARVFWIGDTWVNARGGDAVIASVHVQGPDTGSLRHTPPRIAAPHVCGEMDD